MANLLLSGPAGGGKSAVLRELLAEATEPTIASDFQSIVAALLQHQRLPDGKYPLRPDWVLPVAERIRREIFSAARDAQIRVIGTNSRGDADFREMLLRRLGASAVERVVDPGEAVVRIRLADAATGELSGQCDQAIGRWYARR